jgi:hypothetical protein
MYMATCAGCKFRDDCDHRAFMRQKLRGAGITSVKFICKIRETIFKPGQPVIFRTFVSADDDLGNALSVEYRGYCIEQVGTKVIGFIQPGEHDINDYAAFEPKSGGFVKMPLMRVRTDDSRPAVVIERCRFCDGIPTLGTPCGKDPAYTPSGVCLADRLAALEPDIGTPAPRQISEER